MANNAADLFDGSILQAINVTELNTVISRVVITGSASDGTPDPDTPVGGGILGGLPRVATGNSNTTTSHWIRRGVQSPLASGSLYGISGVLTATVAPVPTPSALWLFGTGLLGLIGYQKWSHRNR